MTRLHFKNVCMYNISSYSSEMMCLEIVLPTPLEDWKEQISSSLPFLKYVFFQILWKSRCDTLVSFLNFVFCTRDRFSCKKHNKTTFPVISMQKITIDSQHSTRYNSFPLPIYSTAGRVYGRSHMQHNTTNSNFRKPCIYRYKPGCTNLTYVF